MLKNRPTHTGDEGSISALGKSPGEGNGNPLQYSCLGNPMDRGDLMGYSPCSLEEEPGGLQSMESQRVGHS